MAQAYTTTPAPYKGLNTVDSLAAMDPAYGLSIQNFIATPQGLSVRQGYRKWSTGLPTSVTTLIPYNARATNNNKLFAVSGTAIYDCTSGGAVGSPVVTGLSNIYPFWQTANQTASTSSNNHLFAVNGSDTPLTYDGTSWTTCSQVATPSAAGQFSITDNNGNAVNISNFKDVVLHQQRLWFTSNSSTIAYYCPIATAGGQLNAFDFGPDFPRGGFLWTLASWTVDTGLGSQALMAAISSNGDVAIYQGNDPASSTTWGIIGTYSLGSPVGQQCTTPLAGDLLYLSLDGLYPLSKYIQSSRVDATSALSYKISPTISSLTDTFQHTSGWDMVVYPSQNVLLLNAPQSDPSNNFQFCFETITVGWSQFTGWPSQCYSIYNDALYFGGPGYVALAFIGAKDGADITGTGGNNIVATAVTAFTELNTPGLKMIGGVKPYIATGQGSPSVHLSINTDFNMQTVQGTATIGTSSGSTWNNATWNNVTWSGSLIPSNQWSSPPSYPAEYVSISISISSTADARWSATNWMYTAGSVFG